MRMLAVFTLLTLGLAGSAAAAPHKILVLPVDGTADAATRAKLTTQLVKLAKGLDGQVATAEATYADTALAVGCDPRVPSCSDQVLATLAVDELVWATATKDGGQIKVVVRRATKGAAPHEASTTIAASDAPDRIDAGMSSLFPPRTAPGATPEPAGSRSTAHPSGAAATSPTATQEVAAQPVPPPEPRDDGHDRTMGIAFATGGGAALVLGIALWASYSSLQDSIDRHPTATRSDFDDLISLEDRASTRAIAGDCLVIAGLAAGGIGAYYLYRIHARHQIAVTPAPIPNGAGLTLTILGGF